MGDGAAGAGERPIRWSLSDTAMVKDPVESVGRTGNVEKAPSTTDRPAGGRPRILPPGVVVLGQAEETDGPWLRLMRAEEGV